MPDQAEWYYSTNHQQLGPVPVETLRQMLAGGQVRPSDLVWTEGMPQWTPAGAVATFGDVVTPATVMTPAPPGGPGMLGYATPVTDAGLLTAGVALRYATFWERFVAAFIDGLITGVPTQILTYGVSFALQSMS